MDPITQGLLGASAGQAGTVKRLGGTAWIAGLLAGMAPDLDVLIRSAHNPLLFIKYHRHFTHAFAFIPVGALIIAGLLLLLVKSMRKDWSWVILACLLGYATHGLLDALTSYGTVLFWPFSEMRVSLDVIAIIDPVYTSILLVGVMLANYYRKSYIAILTLALSCSYIGFGVWQHSRAMQLQAVLIKQRQQTATQRRVMPAIGSLTSWRSIYVANNKIHLDWVITPLTKSGHAISTKFSVKKYSQQELPDWVKTTPSLLNDFKTFNWFSDGYLAAISTKPLLLADMRYAVNLKPLSLLWGIEFIQTQPHIKWLRNFTSKT